VHPEGRPEARDVRWAHKPSTIVRRTARALIAIGDAPDPVVLRGSAIVVWDALVPPRTIDDLVAMLEATFSENRSEIDSDVGTTLATLVAAGVVEPLPAPAQGP